MEVKGRGQKSYVKFTMHKDKTEEDDQEVENEEEKLIKREAFINIVTDSDDLDSEDMLVPEVLMNPTTDSYDSDTEDMPLLLRRLLF